MKTVGAIPGHPVASPSGRLLLEVDERMDGNSAFWVFRILDNQSKHLVFEGSDRYYVRHTVFVLWGEKDAVWVYSGDTGTSFWEIDGSGIWVKKNYIRGQTEVPEELKKIRPNM